MDERKRLLAIALKLLSTRPRSTTEVKTRLSQKSSNTDLINQIVADLTHQKLLNDDQFAIWYMESRSRSRPRSARMLSFELKQKGITEGAVPEFNDTDLAMAAYSKKKRLWEKLPILEHKQKAARFLASRGFSWEIVNKVLKLV